MHCFRIIALFVFASIASMSAGCSLEWGLTDDSSPEDEPCTAKDVFCHGKERGAEAEVQAEFPDFNLEELSAVRVMVRASSDPPGKWHPCATDALSVDAMAHTVTYSCDGSGEDIEVRFIKR